MIIRGKTGPISNLTAEDEVSRAGSELAQSHNRSHCLANHCTFTEIVHPCAPLAVVSLKSQHPNEDNISMRDRNLALSSELINCPLPINDQICKDNKMGSQADGISGCMNWILLWEFQTTLWNQHHWHECCPHNTSSNSAGWVRMVVCVKQSWLAHFHSYSYNTKHR